MADLSDPDVPKKLESLVGDLAQARIHIAANVWNIRLLEERFAELQEENRLLRGLLQEGREVSTRALDEITGTGRICRECTSSGNCREDCPLAEWTAWVMRIRGEEKTPCASGGGE